MSDYYSDHYQEYHAETYRINPEPFLTPFVQQLAPGALVLDVGCASGRDLVWFKINGFKVMGFERSTGLATLARRHANCDIIVGDFGQFDFSRLNVDAILMCGSLVHVPHNRLPQVLGQILEALKPTDTSSQPPGAIVYLSLKEGGGSEIDQRGRKFYFWRDNTLRAIFKRMRLEVISCQRSVSADGQGKIWLGYVCGVNKSSKN